VKSPRVIAISGASSGLGAALAREYAAPGKILALAARRIDRLRQLAHECEKRGASVLCRQVDVRDFRQITRWVEETEQSTPVDLMIANAGVFSGHGPEGQMESIPELVRLVETNLAGAIATFGAMAEHMRKRRHGHIAIISSLAAIQPLADAPVYSATKAGVMAYGEAMREYLADDNIAVSIVLPGHMKTAQTTVHAGVLAGIISSGKAAAIIRKRLDRGQSYIAFPHSMHILVRLGRLLPWPLRAWTNRPFRFHVKPALKQDDEYE